MLSKTSQYGMRAVLYIATHSTDKQKVGLPDIAEGLDIPRPYLAKIMQQLTAAGLVQSVKGPGGGFYLTDETRKQPLLKVVEELDGNDLFTRCALGLNQCSTERPCAIHKYVIPFRDAMYSALVNFTVDDLQRDLDRGHVYITNLGRFDGPGPQG